MQKTGRLLPIITALFVTALLTANIVAVKLFVVAGIALPAGVVIFPLSYLFGDVLTEVYGYAQARRVIWLGFFCNLLMVAAIWIAQGLPAAPFWHGQGAYEQILGFTPRLLVASFAAYLLGEFVNSFVLAKLKIATRGRWLWTRTIGSTVVGQALDSAVFVTLAFTGTGVPDLGSVILAQWLFKSAYEIVATPLTYLVVNTVKRVEGIDTFDDETDFRPVPIGSR
ncbi:MAG: queuosine precursor transporter [Chloroflexota bacterium]